MLPPDMRQGFMTKAEQAIRDEAIRPTNQNLTLNFLKDFKVEVEKAARNGYLSKAESKAEAARAAIVTRNFYRQHPELLNSARAGPEGGDRGNVTGSLVDPDTISSNAWIAMPLAEREAIKDRWARHIVRNGGP